jgi:hypothetical protein
VSVEFLNSQRDLRRLHSQQLKVPLRICRRADSLLLGDESSGMRNNDDDDTEDGGDTGGNHIVGRYYLSSKTTLGTLG